jgi:hypothetical protein
MLPFYGHQPLLNKTDDIQVENPANYDFLGYIGVGVYWRDLLTNLLPPGSDGIIIVIDNECNPSFSFQVNGPDVDYLGRGDFHNVKYDTLEHGVSKRLARSSTSVCCRIQASRRHFSCDRRNGCSILIPSP